MANSDSEKKGIDWVVIAIIIGMLGFLAVVSQCLGWLNPDDEQPSTETVVEEVSPQAEVPVAPEGDDRGEPVNEADRLARAVESLGSKASAMNEAYDALFIENSLSNNRDRTPGLLVSLLPQQPPATTTPVPTPTALPPTPTPTMAPGPGSKRRDRAVQEAWDLVERLSEHAGTPEHRDAIDGFREVWNVKYEKANEAFSEFEEEQRGLHELSESYLSAQEALTEQMHDSPLKDQQRAYDAETRDWITQYQLHAVDLLNQAKAMKRNLDNVTLVLEKTALDAYLPREFHTGLTNLPGELSSLSGQIDLFIARSNTIRADIRGERALPEPEPEPGQ